MTVDGSEPGVSRLVSLKRPERDRAPVCEGLRNPSLGQS